MKRVPVANEIVCATCVCQSTGASRSPAVSRGSSGTECTKRKSIAADSRNGREKLTLRLTTRARPRSALAAASAAGLPRCWRNGARQCI